MPTYDKEKGTTFYGELQKLEGLDKRDNRGKRHDLPFVLLGVILGLLRKRDGKLSSIHRSMSNTHGQLCQLLGCQIEKVVSRAQLPRLLSKVDLYSFDSLLFEYYSITLSAEEKKWFAGDGKELRGSIEPGSKRGEVLVQLVGHEDRGVLGQANYNGKKESEKTCLINLIKSKKAAGQKITADALHLSPTMTRLIEKADGIYIIGLKANQQGLLADMQQYAKWAKPIGNQTTLEKGHGRLEERSYFQYDVGKEYFGQRWQASGFRSLFKVIRKTTHIKTNGQSLETAYYLSNGGLSGPVTQPEEYFKAIRTHWSVEVVNHIRDVGLDEDGFRTKKSLLQR